jgi:ABC-type multidrug transport system fused ATPase/permease subunit
MKLEDYRQAFVTGWRLAGANKLFAGAELLSTVLVQLSHQYSVQLVTIIISLLSAGAAGQPAHAASGGGGLLAALFPQTLERAAVLFVLASVTYIATSFASRFIALSSDNRMQASLQSRLHDNLLRKDLPYHRRHLYAETSTIVLRYANTAQGMLKDWAYSPVTRGVPLLTAIALLASNLSLIASGAPTELVALIVIAVIAIPLANNWLAHRAAPAILALRQLDFDVSREFKNSAQTPTEITILGAIGTRSEIFSRLLQTVRYKRVAASRSMELSRQFSTLAPEIVQAIILIYCVIQTVSQGNVAATGAILGVYYFVPQVMSPVQQTVQFVNMIQSVWPTIEPVLELYKDETPSAPSGVSSEREGPRQALSADLTDVGLSVAADDKSSKTLLAGVTAKIEKGACVGIIGKSGSGKTTILLCLARLLRPDAGSILLEGRDIGAFSENELRHRVSVLSQFPLVVDGTLRENFQLALPTVSDQQIVSLCQEVGVWDAVVEASRDLKDPLLLNLSMEANQDRLSGGQRRLLMLARALVREPDLLLYDEPTTGVDLKSQSAIVAAVSKRKGRCTQVIVDHNVEFVCEVCDSVICIDAGRISAAGSPSELIASAQPNLLQQLAQARKRMGI